METITLLLRHERGVTIEMPDNLSLTEVDDIKDALCALVDERIEYEQHIMSIGLEE